MPTPIMGQWVQPIDRRTEDGARDAAALTKLCEAIRLGRITASLSQAELAKSVGMSRSKMSKIENGQYPSLTLLDASALLAVVGYRLAVNSFPVSSPYRDAAHKALLGRLLAVLHTSVRRRVEVSFPNRGDLWSWDAVLRVGLKRIGVEAETRVRDGQELLRRMASKRRDGGVDRLILLLADTRPNRAFVRDWKAELAGVFTVPGAVALKALREGVDPGGDAVILI